MTSITDAQLRGWASLAASSAQLPTQDAPWAIAGLAAFGVPGDLLAVGPDDAPDAIAPLVHEGGGLELVGLRETHEPGDLLARSSSALDELARTIVATGRPLLLHRIPSDSPSIAALRRANRHGVVRASPAPGHPTIALGPAWCEPGGGLSSSRRSSLRRARRHGERTGDVGVELLAPAPDQVDELLVDAFAIEARSWKGAVGTALEHSPRLADFVRRYARETAARGTLRLQFLSIGGRRVAMQIAVEWRERMWLLKVGFDDTYAEASPGQLLLAESVADAARRGLRAYELLGESSAWTRVWTAEEHRCVSLAVYPPSRRGIVAFGGAAGRSARVRMRGRARDVALAAEHVAAAKYVAGPDVIDGVREERRYATAGYLTTVGFWNDHEVGKAEVTRVTSETAQALPGGSQLSIKQPSIGGGDAALDELLACCRGRELSLHFDALAPETAEGVLRAATRLAGQAPGEIGCTLPGRWRRSPGDALLAIEHALRVRVVKSEWEDPAEPSRDPRDGFLAVVDALAGQAPHVAIATHDAPLAATSLDRLIAQGTPCELQVLHGMNGRAAVREARRRDVPVRVYVPFGNGRVPYSIFERDPRTLARFAWDVLPLASILQSGIPL